MKKFILIIICCLFFSCAEKVTKVVETSYDVVIIKKYVEQRNTNKFGAFVIDHYFLYNNGEIDDEINIEEYIKYEVGDTLTITKTIEL